MMKATQENIRQKHHLPSVNWRKFIRLQVVSPRKMRHIAEGALQATLICFSREDTGYQCASWKHIMNVSVTDLEEELCEPECMILIFGKGESDAQPYIPDMVDR